MDYTDKSIVMGNGDKYLVVEQVTHNGKDYVYLINDKVETDAVFAEINDNEIKSIDSELFKKEILPLFIEKFKE